MVFQPGFQGSETSGALVTFYRHGSDPVTVTPANILVPTGRYAWDSDPCLFSVSTDKGMGNPTGSFVVQLKPSKKAQDIFDSLVDDDWVDISFFRHDRKWHTIRGLIDEIRMSKIVSGTGATSTMYTITGRDFSKIWDTTPIWFAPWANDFVTKAIANRILGPTAEVWGHPGNVVKSICKSFLEEIANQAGPNWALPEGMPGVDSSGILSGDNIKFQTEAPYFQNIPARKSFNLNFMQMNGTLWTLAQQLSDPGFTEFFMDLVPDGDIFSQKNKSGIPVSETDTQMTIILRDRPFPVVDSDLLGIGYSDQWESLPKYKIPKQQIISQDIGKSGIERYNAFLTTALINQELQRGNTPSLLAPLLHTNEIAKHGLRRMDVQAATSPAIDENIIDFVALAEHQRRLMRDWYALNPHMLSGSLDLAVVRPEIRIGSRVQVEQHVSQVEENYYVEQVTHNWTFGSSAKTTLGITRGWRGNDADYLSKLQQESAKYEVPPLP